MDLPIRGSRAEGPSFPPASRFRRDLHASRAGSARGPLFAGLSAWRVLLLLLCVVGLATAVMATDYTWIGVQNDCALPYYDAAYWSPDPGWPNCCDDQAFVSDVCAGSEESVIELTVSGLSGVGIEQLTVSEGANDHEQQAVVFQNVDPYDGYPVLKCEVYVVDATNADYEVVVRAYSYAEIQTMGTCICSN